MKKCPICNSSRIRESLVEGVRKIRCQKCGYVNVITKEQEPYIFPLDIDKADHKKIISSR